MSAEQPIEDWHGFGFDTRQVHSGEYADRNNGLRVPPIALSAGYVFEDFDDQVERFAGRVDEPIYSRQGNPSNTVAEKRLASLEGGVAAVAVASGQAAISSALFALAQQGDHIVSTASIYGGTRTLFTRTFARFGVGVDYVWDVDDDGEWERAITPSTKAIYTETIPNPCNDIVDIRRIVDVARKFNLPVVVDNTVATPALLRPLELGADVIVHSATKFLAGHGAIIAGAVVDGGTFDWEAAERAGRSYPLITQVPQPGGESLRDRFGASAYARAVREAVVNDLGPSLSAFNSFLLHQGMETLSLRMQRHVESSVAIAAWLEQQPEVEKVDYAGLPSSPLYQLAVRDYGVDEAGFSGTGSVFAVTVRGGIQGARNLVNALQLFSRMTGIGDTRSMVLHPRTSTHARFAPEVNDRLGISPGLLRLSIGLETVEDLMNDLRRGLNAV